MPCSATQLEQPWTPAIVDAPVAGIEWPDVPISENRQMYVASALGKHGLTSTAAFFSPRNLAVLGALKAELESVEELNLRAKLRFAFTAILSRASKRYQWSRQRPLNAANANYYVAPVFYEWNVFDLFGRKIEATIRSDEWIREARGVAPYSQIRTHLTSRMRQQAQMRSRYPMTASTTSSWIRRSDPTSSTRT